MSEKNQNPLTENIGGGDRSLSDCLLYITFIFYWKDDGYDCHADFRFEFRGDFKIFRLKSFIDSIFSPETFIVSSVSYTPSTILKIEGFKKFFNRNKKDSAIQLNFTDCNLSFFDKDSSLYCKECGHQLEEKGDWIFLDKETEEIKNLIEVKIKEERS